MGERRVAIHVVAGVLVEDDRVCVTQRRADVHQAGKWEFPGGKLEAGEAPYAGLERELREELGITVERAEPFVKLRHRYPDLDVLLDVWRVRRYSGVPHGRESQALAWMEIAELDPRVFPEADRPVLRRLQLPSLYLVSDAGRAGPDTFLVRLEQALRAGARLVQLREPAMTREPFCAYARRVGALCRRFGAKLLVNAEPDWVEACGADGIHLSARRLLALPERPLDSRRLVAASCHSAAELERAERLGVDFAVLGPVKPTASHPGAATLGWQRFAELCARSSLPIYAIGGMQPGDVAAARTAGAHGVAMIRGIWDRDDVTNAVRQALVDV